VPGPTRQPDAGRCGGARRPIAATMPVAVIGPMPGIWAIALRSTDCFIKDWMEISMKWMRSSIARRC
jgi:hypothetical protein